MTKRLLAALLALAMVLSVLPASAVSAEPMHDNTHACQDESCKDAAITWKPWTGTEKEGHYYLTGDITLAKEVSLNGNSLHLCLAGHTVSGTNQSTGAKVRLFSLQNGAKLTVSDCTTELDKDGKFVSGGCLTGGSNGSTAGAIYAKKTTKANQNESVKVTLIGIEVSGNTCTATSSGGWTGGAVHIRDGAQLVVKNCLFQNNTAREGGAILLRNGGIANIADTVFQKNGAVSGGGAIYATNGTVTLKNSTVTQNTNSGNGGSAFHIANATTFTIQDTTVTGNTSTRTTGDAWDGALCQANAASRYVLTGKVVIDANFVKNGDIERNVLLQYVDSKLGIDGLAAGSSVSILTKNWNDGKDFQYSAVADLLEVSAETQLGTWQHEWVYYEDNESYVFYDDLVKKLLFTGNPVHDHCLCGDGQGVGCTHDNVIWQPWGDDEAEKGKLPTDSGSYYLVDHITLTQNANLSTNDDIRICLHGKTVKVDYETEGQVQDQVYYMTRTGKLTLSDCTAKTVDGVYTAGKLTGGSKGVISLNKLGDGATENTLVIYDGILSGNTNTTDGGAINMTAGSGSFTMYGGEISGNYAANNGGAISAAKGSTVTISAGTISHNNADKSGGAIAAVEATVTISGGQISDNTATTYGGAVYANKSTVTMDKMLIEHNGATDTGGAIAISNYTDLTVNGGRIADNEAKNAGAVCVMSNAHLTLKGGSITKNKVTGDGGAIYVSQNGNLTLSGGSITENTAGNKGGGLYVTGTSKQLALTGAIVVQNNTAGGKLSNLQLGGGKTMTVSQLDSGAKVGITADRPEIYISTETENFSGLFTSDDSTYAVKYQEGKLYLDHASDHRHCLCDSNKVGCDHSTVIWAAWGDDEDEKGKLPTDSGSYYLTENITLSVASNVSANDDIHICLNGKTVKVDYETEGQVQDQIFFMTRNGKLTISDCQAFTSDGNYVAGKLTGGSKGVISLNKLGDGVTENTLVIYDGILSGNTNTTDGGAINITAGSGSFTMYGGEISGNTATGMGGGINAAKGSTVNICGGTINNNTAVKNGGAIAAVGATLNISGGILTGNTGDNGAALYLNGALVSVTGGVVSKNTAKTAGGVAAISNASAVEFSGGEFLENTAPNGGGLCIMSSSDVIVSGGKFAGNTVTANGAALYVSRTGSLTVSGGEISGNTAAVHGGGIFVDYDGELTLSGGTITGNTAGTTGGGVSVHADTARLNVNGKPVIQDNKVGSSKENLHLRGQVTMQVGDMEAGARIGITADSLPRYISAAVSGDPISAFVPDNSYRIIALKDNRLYMDVSGEHQHCLCGEGKDANCKHDTVKWAAWEATDALPTETGSYYLLSDVVLSAAAPLRTGVDVQLCLNGHTVRVDHAEELNENDRVYILRNNAKLTLSDCTAATDSKGNYTAGKLTGGTMAGVILHGNASATFDMYDGIITGNSRSDNVGGGVILRETTGKNVFNMYGGEISENWAKGNGGALYVKEGCTFNMYGGTIQNNKSTNFHGGGIAIVKDGTVNMYGGTVTGNISSKNGGGIFVQEGTLNIMGGNVDGNTAGSNGGGISAITANVNISGGSISRNTAKAAAGAVSVSTKTILKISGGKLDSNKAKDGGGICIMSNSHMYLSGGSVGYNTAEANAGGIYVSRTGKLTMSGGSVHHNTCPRNGGGIFLNNAELNLSGGDISYNATETASGGILIGSNSVVNMTGGNVRGNTAVRGAGAVVLGKGTLNLKGGKFQGNIAEVEAGAIYVSTNSFFTMSGGEICENEAAYRGGGLLANASFTISGGTIRANKVTGSEKFANPYAGGVVIIGESDKTLTMTGGTICDNYSAGTGGGMRINYMNTLNMTGGTFKNNVAEKTAGGLEVYGHANITGGEFIENKAGTVGGGLRVVSQVRLNVTDTLFQGNTAKTRGGAIYLAKGNWTELKNCTITGNTAGEQGSAIYSWDELLLDGCIITGNTAGGNGAVYLCSANYDGQSYVLSVPKIAGDLKIEGNSGPCPGLYFEEGAVAAVASQGLGKNANVEVYLTSGVLTNTLFGSYDYEGGECVYTVTYGDRSEKEYEEFQVPQTDAESTEQEEKAADLDWLLYTGVGVFAVAATAVLILLLLKKKKNSKAAEATEE